MGITYLELIIVSIISVIPLLSSIFISKIFNKIHGVITFFFMNYTFYYFLNDLLGSKNFLNDLQIEMLLGVFYIPYNLIYQFILIIPMLNDLITPKEKYFSVSIVVIIYIISQIISSLINKLKN